MASAAERIGVRRGVSLRVAPDTHAALELAASKAGRSITQEVAARLEMTLADDRALVAIFGDENRYSLMASMIKAAKIAEESASPEDGQALAMLACKQVAEIYFGFHAGSGKEYKEYTMAIRAREIAKTAVKLRDHSTAVEMGLEEPSQEHPHPLPEYKDEPAA